MRKPNPWAIDPSLVDPKWEMFHKHLRGAFGVFSQHAHSHDGATYMDYSRGRQHGTVDNSSGDVSTAMLRNGKSISFTGDPTNDRVDLGSVAGTDPLGLVGAPGCTIVARAKYSGTENSVFPRIFDKSNAGGGANGHVMYYDTSATPKFFCGFQDGVSITNINQSFDYTLTAGETFDVGFKMSMAGGTATEVPGFFNGKPMSMGAPVGTGLTSFASTTTNAAIGNWNHTTDRMWGGEIEFVYVLGISMPDSFFRDIYEDPYGPFRRKPALVGRILVGTIASGVGSSIGAAVATSIGAPRFAGVGASVGVATVLGVGAPRFAGVGSSAGIAAVAGIGAPIFAGVGSSAGIAAVAGIGELTAAAVALSTGTAVATGVSAATKASVGSSSGVASVNGVGKDAAGAVAGYHPVYRRRRY